MDWANILEAKGFTRPKAVAHARAAQILAEMLATVCHPEYFADDTGASQTVHPSMRRINDVEYHRAF
jgi:hypothetical protein